MSDDKHQPDDIIMGVPAIAEEAAGRFAKKPSERMVRYWLEKEVIRANRMQSVWAIGRRSLHRQLDKIAGG